MGPDNGLLYGRHPLAPVPYTALLVTPSDAGSAASQRIPSDRHIVTSKRDVNAKLRARVCRRSRPRDHERAVVLVPGLFAGGCLVAHGMRSTSDAPPGPGDRVSSSRDASSSDDAASPDTGAGWSSDAWDGSSSDLSLPGERPSAVPDHCSVSGGPSVVLTFQNRLSDRTIAFNWVNLSCVEVIYAKVGPGLTYRVSTFGGHTWRARDSSSGALMKELVIAATPAAQQASVPSVSLPARCPDRHRVSLFRRRRYARSVSVRVRGWGRSLRCRGE